MRRLPGIAFGMLAQLLLLATLPSLYRFLCNDFAAGPDGPLWIDAVLALSFAIPHSLMLCPPTRKFVTRGWLPPELYGCLFCVATCLSLWLQFSLWRGSRTVVWAWPESIQPAVNLAYHACWGLLFYGLYLSGLGYQTGLAPWWHWVHRRSLPRREWHANGAYRYVRHPVYFSFLGLVWLTPILTADRVLLIGVWTAYVFVGSYLKDRRLAHLLGEPYLQYMEKVPAYPLITWTLRPRGALVATSIAGATPETLTR